MLIAQQGRWAQAAQDYPHFSRFVSNFHSPALKRWQSFTVLVLVFSAKLRQGGMIFVDLCSS